MILLIQELQEKYDLLDENLNSIMILLILTAPEHPSIPHLHLNSIMILLILASPAHRKGYTPAFKFHYDSINSKIWFAPCNCKAFI